MGLPSGPRFGFLIYQSGGTLMTGGDFGGNEPAEGITPELADELYSEAQSEASEAVPEPEPEPEAPSE